MKGDITQTKTGAGFVAKLISGVDLVGDMVGGTIGPYGRNVLIERRVHAYPIATNDGKRVIKAVNPKDPVERMVVRSLEDAANNTDLKAGDGTTGTVVLAQAIVHKVFHELEKNAPDLGVKMTGMKQMSVVKLRKDINEARDKVLKALEKSRRKITSLEDLEKVAVTSVEDEKMGKVIAGMVKKIGVDGHIFVEEGFTFETQTEVIEGMKFWGKLAANFMIIDRNRMETTLQKPPILVTNLTLKNVNEFGRGGGNWLGDDLMKKGENVLVVMAWKFEKDFLRQIADIWKRTGFKIICIKVPAITTEQLQDVAVYVGTPLIDENTNMKLSDVSMTDLGSAEKLTANAEETVIVGGKGTKTEIEKRISEVKEQIKVEKLPEFRKKLEQRIADLSSGIGVIKIGNSSQLEQLYVLDKVQDAVLATKCAMRDGVVKGGGLALKEIVEKLPQSILTEPLKAPYQRIQENAGEPFEIPDHILDPYLVVKAEVENACSVAGTLITTFGGIYDEVDYTLENFKDEIKRWADKIQGIENPMPEDPALDR